MNLPTCLRTRLELLGEVRYLRAALNEAQSSEAWAITRMAELEQAASLACNDWTVHLRLAHEVEQLQAQIAEARGSDPHNASLEPRRGA